MTNEQPFAAEAAWLDGAGEYDPAFATPERQFRRLGLFDPLWEPMPLAIEPPRSGRPKDGEADEQEKGNDDDQDYVPGDDPDDQVGEDLGLEGPVVILLDGSEPSADDETEEQKAPDEEGRPSEGPGPGHNEGPRAFFFDFDFDDKPSGEPPLFLLLLFRTLSRSIRIDSPEWEPTLDEKRDHLTWKFPRFEDFVKAAETIEVGAYGREHGIPSMTTPPSKDWCHVDWKGAVRLAKDGWPEALKLIKKHEVDLQTTTQRMKRSTMTMQGGQPIVPLYLAGDPMHMRQRTSQDRVTRRRSIRLVMPMAMSAYVDQAAYQTYGLAIMSLVDALEDQGIRVALTVCWGTSEQSMWRQDRSKKLRQFNVVLNIKEEEEQLDRAGLVFQIASSSMFRRFVFKFIEAQDHMMGFGHGRPSGVPRSAFDDDEACIMPSVMQVQKTRDVSEMLSRLMLHLPEDVRVLLNAGEPPADKKLNELDEESEDV